MGGEGVPVNDGPIDVSAFQYLTRDECVSFFYFYIRGRAGGRAGGWVGGLCGTSANARHRLVITSSDEKTTNPTLVEKCFDRGTTNLTNNDKKTNDFKIFFILLISCFT